ncbi:protein mono-ADP-ribosyltransferase PARP6-like isoform X3 [Eleginops maclovinus]|uniref:protein mono-ADP-ribosyltransferase PARP6-like isoform X3 n=1 Tax=Eleginops maclovinus TaxID=56733 RepID=UPI00308043A2
MLEKCQTTEHMETGCQQERDSQTDEDSDSEEILCGVHYLSRQESCATDLTHHPQLDTDIDAVKTLYSDSAVSIREYVSIEEVDVDLNINANILDEDVAKAWRINPSDPIVIRLHFSSSQYLDGPAPSVEVFQPSNRDNFSLRKQLQNILTVFLSQEWKHLTCESIVVRQKRGHSWFRSTGTIKKFRARLSIWLTKAKSSELHERTVKGRIISPAMKINHATSYTINNPQGDLFTYTPSGKRVVVSAVKSSAQLSTKQLIELLFSTQAIKHCKTTPTLQHGFLVQVMTYVEQRLPTLNEYCVVCDERHVLQNGPMLKPAVCTRELCVFSFHTFGIMSGATEEVATGAEVVDLLVAMCRAALQSARKNIVLEPYPSVLDPCNPQTLVFNPKRKSYDRLQKALDNVLLIRRMSQGPYSEIKKQMDMIDPLAHPLLQWILKSNRSHIVKLPLDRLHGAAYGKGIYLSPISSISFGYSEMGKGRHQMDTKEELIKKYNQINKLKQEPPGQDRFLQNRNLNCIALCEVITSKDLQKHGNIWVCPIPEHVCTRFLFVYENGQVGDVHIDTEEDKIHREILQVIASKPC